MRISVIGSGYVGVVTGACLAKLGNKVTLIDVDEQKVETINNGKSPIYEEGLDEILRQVHIEGGSDYQRIMDSELVFICVGTVSNRDGAISLEQVEQATKQIAEVLKRREDYCVICVKSTVTPGATEEIVVPTLEKSGKKAGTDFGVCMSPEFLSEGKAVHDFMNPARVVIGEYDKRSGDVLSNLYKNFSSPIVRTNLRTAEMIKLAANAFLATKLSFINEIGNICKKLDIDIYEVAEAMGLDERIGNKFLNAGIGFGGSCLPKDLGALIASSKQLGYEPRVLEAVLNLNDKQALKLVELLKKHITLQSATVGILGLAFKPGTDDIRESGAIKIVQTLLQEGAKVKAYDPVAVENFRKLFPQVEYVTKEKVLDSDAILIVTEWQEFNELDFRGKLVIDGRRILEAKKARIYEGACW